MRANQVDLQLTILRRLNAHVAQLPDAGGDGVCDLVFRDQSIHHSARGVDFFTGVARRQHCPALVHNGTQIVEGKVGSVEPDGIHELFFCRCGANAVTYFSGSERRWNLSSTMMCMVSPVASNVRSPARNTS